MNAVDTAAPPGAVGRAPRHGTIAAAWQSLAFRRLYIGSSLSMVGTWLQNVTVNRYALDITRSAKYPKGSATFAGYMNLAQLGPLLLLSIAGGVLANRVDRKRMMIGAQTVQAIAAFTLALIAWKTASPIGLLLTTMVIGIANAVSAPTTSSVLPELVDRRDMAGAISLNSGTMNGSRALAPLVAIGLAALGVGVSGIFLINALSYFALIIALWGLPMNRRIETPGSTGRAAFLDGIREARVNPVVGRILLILFSISLISLPYIGQFATIVERNLGTKSRNTYLILFGIWGLGAAVGALSIGTFLSKFDQRKTVRWFFLLFAVSLLAWTYAPSPVVAGPIALVLGFAYFGSTTAMSSVMQLHLDHTRRAPIMALWFMAFGGTVAFGAMWGGWSIDHWSLHGTLLIGVAGLLVAAWLSRDLVGRSERWKAMQPAAQSL